MANSDARFSGKYALRSVTNGQYLTVDQSTGHIVAAGGTAGPSQAFVDYTLAGAGPNGGQLDFFSAATPAQHGFITTSQCWPSDGQRVPAGCILTPTAQSIAQAASFADDSPSYPIPPGQHQWRANGLQVMVPLQFGLGIQWSVLETSGAGTADNRFTTTELVAGWAQVSCPQQATDTWVGADLSFVNLSNLNGQLKGNASNWTGANLQGATASGMDLTEVSISHNVNLRDADFSGVVFASGQDLSAATLVGVDLSNVDLRHVTLSASVDLTGANLAGAKLDGHNLSSAILNGANLTGATLAQVNLSAAQMLGTNFTDTDLTVATFGSSPAFSHDPTSRTIFHGARLPYAIIGTNWTGYDLSDATIVGLPTTIPSLQAGVALLCRLQLDGISFQPAPTFDESDLTGISLKGATLTGGSFKGTTLTDAVLTDAAAGRTVFAGGVLDGASLDSTTPGKAVFDNATFTPASLQGTTLAYSSAKSAVFTDANMTGAVLTGADLTGTNFVGALLYGAALAYTVLPGADFTNAQLGAKEARFTLPWSFVAELNTGSVSAGLDQAFAAQGIELSAAAALTVRVPSQDWIITDGTDLYEIVAQTAQQTLRVLSFRQTDTAAVLTEAYMPNAVLTDANLYACNFADVQWYGQSAKGDNADFEEVDFSNANLSASAAEGMVLTQARMFGARLDHAILVNADLSGAYLGPSATKVSASLVSASLQGTSFTQAQLDSADLTNAAVALTGGVPLFSLAPSLAADLDTGTLSTDVADAFTTSGHPLLTGSTVTVVTAGQEWTVSNGGDVPPTTAVGSVYATFDVVAGPTALPVAGSSLWVTQIGDDGHLATVQVSFGPTALFPSVMTPATTCPNGQPMSAYQSERYTWEEMMTAANPPTPPACIPSPTRWCPAKPPAAPPSKV